MLACSTRMNRHERRRARAMRNLPGPGSTPEQLAERLRFLSCNEMAIQLAVSKQRAAGDTLDVVAMVVDARDSLGREIAQAVDADRKADRIAGENMIPTLLMLVPRQVAYNGVRESHPTIASALAVPTPQGIVPALAIAAEGVTLVHLPIVPPPPEASA